jgi:hypothetical protein
MKPATTRLLVIGTVFLAWLGYLAYQAMTRPVNAAGKPLVVSRPQVLTSDLDVIADVPSMDGTVEITVDEVLFPSENNDVKAGDVIKVSNISECRPPRPRGADQPEPPLDWSGPGKYLLPLKKAPRKGEYEVAPVPPSPGYKATEAEQAQLFGRRFPGEPPRIYPATTAAKAQYAQIAKP